jgi:hypothetical protein
MIKRYNQFIKGKVNEDVYAGEKEVAPAPTTTPTPTITPRPTAPGVVPGEIPSEEDAPLAMYGEEEEEGGDMYMVKLQELANKLNTEVVSEEDGPNYVEYNGQKVIFPSETEMYHVGKKKFKTADEVVNYLEGGSLLGGPESSHTVHDRRMGEEEMMPEFESKSYKFTRKLKSSKRK